MPSESKEPRLYKMITGSDLAPGKTETWYAYGAPWVEQALFMDDIKFSTPQEATAWWDKNYGGEKA